MSESFEFTLEPASFPVKIDGKSYVLKEASLETGMKIRDANAAALIIREGKVVGTKGTSAIEPIVISECLFDDKGMRVPLATIKSWPDRVTNKLFEKINELSGFTAEQSIEELEQRLIKLKQLKEERKNS